MIPIIPIYINNNNNNNDKKSKRIKTEMSSKTYDQPDAVQAHDPAGDP